MHNQDTHLRFIDLRSQELSLERIATEIGVSKPTLVRWDKRFKQQIWRLRNQREMEYDCRVRTADEELARLAANLQRAEIALEEAVMRDLPPDKLIKVSCMLRAEMRRERERKDQCRGQAIPSSGTDPSAGSAPTEPITTTQPPA